MLQREQQIIRSAVTHGDGRVSQAGVLPNFQASLVVMACLDLVGVKSLNRHLDSSRKQLKGVNYEALFSD
jgi:hypothetical protein